jgi:hypothetical protein
LVQTLFGIATSQLTFRPAGSLSPHEAIEVYKTALLSRHFESLQETFTGASRYLGPGHFLRLVQSYLTENPSQHWNINLYGQHTEAGRPTFIEFVGGREKNSFLDDLLLMDVQFQWLFHTKEAPGLSSQELASLFEHELTTLSLVESARLFELKMESLASWRILRKEESMKSDFIMPKKEKSYVLFYKNSDQILTSDLEPTEYDLILLLQKYTVGEALHRFAADQLQKNKDVEKCAQELQRLFALIGRKPIFTLH